jgi:hypothetical protein
VVAHNSSTWARDGTAGSPANRGYGDATGRVHGELPTAEELREYSPDELKSLRDELERSVWFRQQGFLEFYSGLAENEELAGLGEGGNHGPRLAAEEALIRSIYKLLKH